MITSFEGDTIEVILRIYVFDLFHYPYKNFNGPTILNTASMGSRRMLRGKSETTQLDLSWVASLLQQRSFTMANFTFILS
jgi:hypothetical protein